MSSSGIDDFRRCDDETLFRGMRIAARLGLPVAVHAENEGLTAALAAEARAAGRTGVRDFLASRPVAAEVEAISRALLFAEETGCSLHVVHTSSSRAVQLVRQAVEARLCDATCETCPHYLFLSVDDAEELGAVAKCVPPLRAEEEREELLAQVAAGRVDTIGSDHSPSPPAMKDSSSFFDAWGGIAGIQSTLRVLLSVDLPLRLIAALTSENVARRFKLPGKGGLRIGADADITLVDVSAHSALGAEELVSRHRLSPYVGRSLKGVVRRTFVRGNTVFEDGKATGEPVGRFVRPSTA